MPHMTMSSADTLKILPSTPQIKGLHTYIRNRDTPRDEFIFYSKRLIRLVIEYSLSLLPYETVTVDTPQGEPYMGRRCTSSNICGCVTYLAHRKNICFKL